MKLTVISTGSAGNCYFLQAGTGGNALLLDAGVSARMIVRVLRGLRGINACLITHEHGDHISGAKSIAESGIDVFATKGTFASSGLMLGNRMRVTECLKSYEIGAFTVLPFPTQHDACEPCGYLIKCRETGETLLYATDTYYLRNTFPNVHYWLIECNYVDDTVAKQLSDGDIPSEMRNRLLGSHMSLRRLKNTLSANDLTETRKIVLCHLSDERSDEKRMINEIASITKIETVAASNGMIINLDMTPF